MALQRATFSITCDTNGYGSADVTLKLPSELTRPARLMSVSLVRDFVSGQGATITLSELLNVNPTTATWNTSSETVALDRQVVHIDLSKTVNLDNIETAWHPRAGNTVDRFGTPGTATDGSEDGYILIRAQKMRCEVYGANSGDVYTVYVHYETAGDYRF